MTIDIRYHRYITAISGNTIAVDAPVFNHLERSLSQSFIYKYDPSSIRTNIGIEKLLVDIVTAGPESEDHALDAITFVGAENCWLRDATMQHFVHAGVQFTNSTRCTVERARAIDPHSLITGERRYNFSTHHAQLILFRDSFASFARHAFVTNGTSTDSGIVALNSTVDHNSHVCRSASALVHGAAVRWADRGQSARVDDVFGFYNRGNFGTGHGWAAGHSVIWNTNAGGGRILVQKPPTAQNYAIGCFGNVTGAGPFAGPAGYQEGSNLPGLAAAVTLSRAGRAATDQLCAARRDCAFCADAVLDWQQFHVGRPGVDILVRRRRSGWIQHLQQRPLCRIHHRHDLSPSPALSGATAYTFTVHAADAAGNLSESSNAVLVTTAPSSERPTIVFEAEDLAFTAVGANRSVANETFASGGQFPSNFRYVSFGADGTPPPKANTSTSCCPPFQREPTPS